MKRGVLTAVVLLAACGSSNDKHPVSSFAYVGNNDQSSSVSVFKIDPGTGMLTLVKTVASAAGGAP